MVEDEKTAPRSAFDDRHRNSAMRKKYKRPASVREPRSKKPTKCTACGGEHATRSCRMGK